MLSSWPKLQRRSRSEEIYTHNCTQLPNSEKHSFHMENTHAEGVPLSKEKGRKKEKEQERRVKIQSIPRTSRETRGGDISVETNDEAS